MSQHRDLGVLPLLLLLGQCRRGRGGGGVADARPGHRDDHGVGPDHLRRVRRLHDRHGVVVPLLLLGDEMEQLCMVMDLAMAN